MKIKLKTIKVVKRIKRLGTSQMTKCGQEQWINHDLSLRR